MERLWITATKYKYCTAFDRFSLGLKASFRFSLWTKAMDRVSLQSPGFPSLTVKQFYTFPTFSQEAKTS